MTTLADEMKSKAVEAQTYTRKYFVIELNFSDNSIGELDRAVEQVDFALPGGKTDESVERLTDLWGSYLGEVIRRKCGGEWVRREEGVVLKTEQGDLRPHESIGRCLADSDEKAENYYRRIRGAS